MPFSANFDGYNLGSSKMQRKTIAIRFFLQVKNDSIKTFN